MAEEEGAGAPPPLPKRPTIIQPNDADSTNKPLPARRAPPGPGRPPPPARPKSMPPKPAPPPSPSKVLSKPLPPPPNAGAPRRKLEITVVAARPMSEVGFRSMKGASVGTVAPKPTQSTDASSKPAIPPAIGKKGPPPTYNDLYAVPDMTKKTPKPVTSPPVTDDLLDLSPPLPPRLIGVDGSVQAPAVRPGPTVIRKPKAKSPSPDDGEPPPVPQRTAASGMVKPPDEDLLIDFDAPEPTVPKPVLKPHIILPSRNNSTDVGEGDQTKQSDALKPTKVQTIIFPQNMKKNNSKLQEKSCVQPAGKIESDTVAFPNTDKSSTGKPAVAKKPKPPVSSKPGAVKPTASSVSSKNGTVNSSPGDEVEAWTPLRMPTIIPPPKKHVKPTSASDLEKKETSGEFDNMAFTNGNNEATKTPELVEISKPEPKEKPKPPPPAKLKNELKEVLNPVAMKPKIAQKGPPKPAHAQIEPVKAEPPSSGIATATLIDFEDVSSTEPAKSSKPILIPKRVAPARPPPSFKEKTPPPSKPAAPPSKPTKKVKPPKPPLPSRPTPGHPLFHYVVEGPHGIAIYDYEPNNADELAFKASDVIVLLRRVSAEWLYGRNVDKEGMFPQNFIEVVEPLKDNSVSLVDVQPSHVVESTGSGPRCRARFDFEGGEPEDLVFKDGDVIKLLERIGDDWMKGELEGRKGNFPLAFVEIIEDLPLVDTVTDNDNHSTAIYDFDGHDGELSFKTGDVITVLSKVNDDWLYGEVKGLKGNFPIGFINAVPHNLPACQPDQVDHHSRQNGNPHCIAKYEFTAESEGDLSFSVGDRITITSHVGDDWLVGVLHGKEGLFPRAFVDVIEDIQDESAIVKPPAPQSDSRPHGTAVYDFNGETDEELSFKVGDVIYLLKKVNDDWMTGELNGRTGHFPAGFINIIIPL